MSDWNLLRDFEDGERLHSRPKLEYRLTDGEETVILRKTPGAGRTQKFEIRRETLSELCERLSKE